MSAHEIERRFLLTNLPAGVAGGLGTRIQQGYLVVTKRGDEVRLRRRGPVCVQTIKKGTGLVRREVEVTVTEAQFDALWPMTEGRRLEKYRYEVEHDGHTVEVDVFEGALDGLMLAEVEFDSVAASAAFSLPSWFGTEVTEDRRYRNQTLALHGLPVKEDALTIEV